MKSKRKIEVYCPRVLAKCYLGLIVFFIIIMFLDYMTHSSRSLVKLFAMCSIIYVPCGLIALAFALFKVSLKNDIITIRRWYGRKVKFHINDITKVVFIPANLTGMDNQRLKIYSGKRHVTIESLMINYMKMKEYILANVDESIVETKVI